MSERRFVIKEVTGWQAENLLRNEGYPSITESELRRRLELIAAIIANTNGGWREPDLQRSIVVLLFGAGEKGEEPRPDEWPTINIRHKQFEAVRKAMPSPAPNREEWKLWIQDLPRPADDWSDMNAWLDAVEIWLEHGPWMRGK